MGLGIDPRVGKGVNPEVFRPQPGTDHNFAFSGENVGPSAGLPQRYAFFKPQPPSNLLSFLSIDYPSTSRAPHQLVSCTPRRMNRLSMYSLSDSQAVPAVGGVAGLGEAGVAAQAVGEVGVEGDRVRAGDRLQEELQLRAERTVDVLPVASGHAAHRHSRQLETGARGGETRVRLHDARHQPWLSAQLLHLHIQTHHCNSTSISYAMGSSPTERDP